MNNNDVTKSADIMAPHNEMNHLDHIRPNEEDLLSWDDKGKHLLKEFNTGSFYW